MKLINFLISIFAKKKQEQPAKEPDIIQQKIEEANVPKPSVPPSFKAFKNFADISHYEPCDWSQFDGNDLITKATDGLIVDATLKANMDGAYKKGVRFGVYHFYRVNKDPIAQAKHFIKTVGLDNLKSMYHLPIVDYETATVGSKQDEEAMKNGLVGLKQFIKYVNEQTGRKLRIYTYETLLIYLALDAKFFLTYCDEPWLARYGKKPVNFKPWSNMWAWQYSDGEYSNSPTYNDNFKGIGRCDANTFINVK